MQKYLGFSLLAAALALQPTIGWAQAAEWSNTVRCTATIKGADGDLVLVISQGIGQDESGTSMGVQLVTNAPLGSTVATNLTDIDVEIPGQTKLQGLSAKTIVSGARFAAVIPVSKDAGLFSAMSKGEQAIFTVGGKTLTYQLAGSGAAIKKLTVCAR